MRETRPILFGRSTASCACCSPDPASRDLARLADAAERAANRITRLADTVEWQADAFATLAASLEKIAEHIARQEQAAGGAE